ncbi:transposase [Marivita sp. S0852]|uniref:transposase n=1 Tax=Marivita sp. S0852 TaxID=3373893 RepID=UPI003982264E
MPEIGSMDNKQAASLAGLAPVSQSSGKWQGKERIQGGRAQLRKALYMPALVATRVNPDMTKKYNQLTNAGKEEKGRADRHHAEVARHGKCLATRQSHVDRNSALTKTDTPPICPRTHAGDRGRSMRSGQTISTATVEQTARSKVFL